MWKIHATSLFEMGAALCLSWGRLWWVSRVCCSPNAGPCTREREEERRDEEEDDEERKRDSNKEVNDDRDREVKEKKGGNAVR